MDGPFDRDEQLRQEQDDRRELEQHRQDRLDRLSEHGSCPDVALVEWLLERDWAYR